MAAIVKTVGQVAREVLSVKGAEEEIEFLEASIRGVSMIDMEKIDKLVDLIRGEDWKAAHAMLDEEEFVDPDEATVAHWRSVVLRDEGRYQEALKYLKDNQHRFSCQSGVALTSAPAVPSP